MSHVQPAEKFVTCPLTTLPHSLSHVQRSQPAKVFIELKEEIMDMPLEKKQPELAVGDSETEDGMDLDSKLRLRALTVELETSGQLLQRDSLCVTTANSTKFRDNTDKASPTIDQAYGVQ